MKLTTFLVIVVLILTMAFGMVLFYSLKAYQVELEKLEASGEFWLEEYQKNCQLFEELIESDKEQLVIMKNLTETLQNYGAFYGISW